jgi:hypothetical protein
MRIWVTYVASKTYCFWKLKTLYKNYQNFCIFISVIPCSPKWNMAPHTLTFTQTYIISLHIYVYLWIQILLSTFNKTTLVFVTVLYTAILSLKLQDFVFSKWQKWHSRLLVYESNYWQFRERYWLYLFYFCPKKDTDLTLLFYT